jgi:hypothetical protein
VKSRAPSILASTLFSVAVLLFVFPAQAFAQESQKPPSLPSVQDEMDRYTHALGGRDAIFKHKSMTVRSKLEVPAKGLSLDRIVYFKDGKKA